MTLFALGDLHLPGGEEKPIDIFGDHWENHFAHIAADGLDMGLEPVETILGRAIAQAKNLAETF